MSTQSATLPSASDSGRAAPSDHATPQWFGGAETALCPDRRHTFAFCIAALAVAAVTNGATALTMPGKVALCVLIVCIVCWALTDLPDTAVGLAGAAALGISGVLDKSALFRSLGHEFIWFLLSALVIAAILRKSGLVDRAVERATSGAGTVRQLFIVLTLAIAATAFVIPSTSARAAMFLPVFISLAARFDDADIKRGLGLLFPTVILLSAGGSLTGAGAHVFAADFIVRSTGRPVDFLAWAVVAMPFALATSLMACLVILRLFVGTQKQAYALKPSPVRGDALSIRQWTLASAVILIVGLWATTSLHGIDMAMIGMVAVALLLATQLAGMKAKEAFKSVDLDLILFLATTFALIEALNRHGVDRWMAESLIERLPAGLARNTLAAAAFIALVSLLSHLVITSRSARASVLIPTVAMPLVALGHNAELLIMITILGTGFCQTMPASAKPVALFSCIEHATFTNADLLRLSIYLLPVMFASLVGYAFLLWGP